MLKTAAVGAAKAFSEIPGPRAWPLGIGGGYTYLCLTSRYEKSYARAFSEIPGPRAWPLGIGRVYLLMPDH